MRTSKKVLVIGGLLLSLWGMSYGLYYAVFVEHQTLDTISSALAASFSNAAGRKMEASKINLEGYALASYDYTRQVDVHSHWIGLGMLLIGLGIIFHKVSFGEELRITLALALLIGSALFPVGVLLQTVDRGFLPRLIASIGAALVTVSLAMVAAGFARSNE
ncbi:MAG: hypothetical protein DMF61_17340 [Blastocatellia bacterium AA13]|nr:MAG: hypothetical protein DMF61_17340 [Blastocatellia bacterium AA13]